MHNIETFPSSDYWALCEAAKILASDNILSDPADKDIVLASAELAAYDGDLNRLPTFVWKAIVATWEEANV